MDRWLSEFPPASAVGLALLALCLLSSTRGTVPLVDESIHPGRAIGALRAAGGTPSERRILEPRRQLEGAELPLVGICPRAGGIYPWGSDTLTGAR